MHIDPKAILALQLQLLQRKNMANTPMTVLITNPAEWDYLRPTITKMHMDGMELSEIMKQIEIQCRFKAT
jgi:hypothetical protein